MILAYASPTGNNDHVTVLSHRSVFVVFATVDSALLI